MAKKQSEEQKTAKMALLCLNSVNYWATKLLALQEACDHSKGLMYGRCMTCQKQIKNEPNIH